MVNNAKRRITNRIRRAHCCRNCQHKGRSIFRDMVGCGQLVWSEGNDVEPTQICDRFVMEKETVK
jgi:hypothetical protein